MGVRINDYIISSKLFSYDMLMFYCIIDMERCEKIKYRIVVNYFISEFSKMDICFNKINDIIDCAYCRNYNDFGNTYSLFKLLKKERDYLKKNEMR